MPALKSLFLVVLVVLQALLPFVVGDDYDHTVNIKPIIFTSNADRT